VARREERMADFVTMCSSGKVEEVRAALGRGVDVNTTDRMSNTGLMEAALRNQEEVVEVLLAQPGVHVDYMNSTGHTRAPQSDYLDYPR